LADDQSRPGLVRETWFVELAFLVPAVCVLTAAGLSFMPEWQPRERTEAAPEMEEAKV